MNKLFKLTHFKDSAYQCVSISLSNDGLDHMYESLETELKDQKARGRILLDLLLSNGLRSERFISLFFDGQCLDLNSYKVENCIDSKIEDYCSKYYRSQPHLLENSVLTKPQRFLFKKGKLKQSYK